MEENNIKAVTLCNQIVNQFATLKRDWLRIYNQFYTHLTISGSEYKITYGTFIIIDDFSRLTHSL